MIIIIKLMLRRFYTLVVWLTECFNLLEIRLIKCIEIFLNPERCVKVILQRC